MTVASDEQDSGYRGAGREGDVPAVRTVPLLTYGAGRRSGESAAGAGHHTTRRAAAAERQTPRKRRRRKLLLTTVTLDNPIAAAA